MPELTILAISALIVGGLILYGLAWQRRTPECPGITLNPRNWKPIWRMQDWFTPAGYRFNLIGTTCIAVAGVLAILRVILNWA